ncbi:MAG: hypothetical protein BMS9Abin31_0229 [Gammaproteobacteria bacterium]|nr:MAG: hypothetical protein BMS9Abin31_0229 [Gammaproteobacteria bacterium]
MNSQILKLVILASLVFYAGCDITLKRKDKKTSDAHAAMSEQKSKKKSISSEVVFSKKDSNIIASFYSNTANSIIRKNMIRHTNISRKQQKKLVVGKIIPRDFQVMPLPLKLERALSTLNLHLLRVQVGANVVLMNVKSRLILDIIKI